MTLKHIYPRVMRKALAKKLLSTSIALVSISTILPAHSATIAGSKCTKVGTTKKVSSTKYTCIKQGSKLVWNKGGLVKSAATPTSAVSPSAEPSETPSEQGASTTDSQNLPSSSPTPVVVLNVTPGAFCTPAGAIGQSSKGVTYICKSSATDTRTRWRQ